MKKLLLSLVLVASFAPVFAMDSSSDSDDATAQAATNATTQPAADQSSDSDTSNPTNTPNLTKATKGAKTAQLKAYLKANARLVRAKLSDATDYVKYSKAGHIVSTHPVAFKRFGIAAIVTGAIYTAKKVYNRYQARQAEKATENENA